LRRPTLDTLSHKLVSDRSLTRSKISITCRGQSAGRSPSPSCSPNGNPGTFSPKVDIGVLGGSRRSQLQRGRARESEREREREAEVTRTGCIDMQAAEGDRGLSFSRASCRLIAEHIEKNQARTIMAGPKKKVKKIKRKTKLQPQWAHRAEQPATSTAIIASCKRRRELPSTNRPRRESRGPRGADTPLGSPIIRLFYIWRFWIPQPSCRH